MQGIFPSFVSARLRSLPSIDMTSPSTSATDSSHVDFEAACGRSVPTTVSPDERSEESPKAMSIRGAASIQRPVGGGLPSASHWTLNCWTLAAETLRSEATPNVGPFAPSINAPTAIIKIS